MILCIFENFLILFIFNFKLLMSFAYTNININRFSIPFDKGEQDTKKQIISD